MKNIKDFITFIKSYLTERSSPKLTDFPVSNPNGQAGTSDPKSKKLDPDNPLDVKVPRILRDIEDNPNISKGNPIMSKSPAIRKWRGRRERNKGFKRFK